MRFLADVGVSRSTAAELRLRAHDVVHLSEVGLHRLLDEEILSLARREQRVILTFDLDFGDLLAAGRLFSAQRHHLPPSGSDSGLGDTEAAEPHR